MIPSEPVDHSRGSAPLKIRPAASSWTGSCFSNKTPIQTPDHITIPVLTYMFSYQVFIIFTLFFINQQNGYSLRDHIQSVRQCSSKLAETFSDILFQGRVQQQAVTQHTAGMRLARWETSGIIFRNVRSSSLQERLSVGDKVLKTNKTSL